MDINDKKVAILMSTYNGEKYIKEQIDSLIAQTYKETYIYIRDDGSKDNTVNIIKKYKESVNNIILIEGENIGFINSFFELLNYCKDADYYAYCDQDDIWMEDKIQRAVNFLDKTDNTKPVLYFSNSDYYDSEMNFISTAEVNKIYNFRNSLVECVSQGMTMVVNNKVKEIIVKNKPQNALYHDWWTYMICSGFGEIIYDDKSLVKYRRHTQSVTVEGKNILQLMMWRVKKFLVGDSLKQIKRQLEEYENLYKDNLNVENQKLIDMFTRKRYNFVIALKKTFYPKRFRRKLIDEVGVRILFLFGKL